MLDDVRKWEKSGKKLFHFLVDVWTGVGEEGEIRLILFWSSIQQWGPKTPGDTPYNGLSIRGVPARKGHLLKASGISQVGVYERVYREICYFSLQKGPKGATDEFYGNEKFEKTFLFCGLFIFSKTVHFQGMESSKLGMWKGYHLSM